MLMNRSGGCMPNAPWFPAQQSLRPHQLPRDEFELRLVMEEHFLVQHCRLQLGRQAYAIPRVPLILALEDLRRMGRNRFRSLQRGAGLPHHLEQIGAYWRYGITGRELDLK